MGSQVIGTARLKTLPGVPGDAVPLVYTRGSEGIFRLGTMADGGVRRGSGMGVKIRVQSLVSKH